MIKGQAIWFLVAMMLLQTMPALADTILLRNGRKLQGIIASEETDPDVVLEVGAGSVTLSPEEVAWITRSTIEEHETLRKDWSKRALYSEANIQLGTAPDRLRSNQETRLLESLKSSRS